MSSAHTSWPAVVRGRTAMRRHSCSRPIATAIADGLVGLGKAVFDYGCGHGGDIRFLESRGIRVSGWDPAHRPDAPVLEADVVNIGYVLNVIDDPRERAQSLARAFSLAREVLIVSVRVDSALDHAESCGDGVVTGHGTFQKLFTNAELLAFVESVTGAKPHLANVGVAYVFRSEEAEARYLATRAFGRRLEYRTDLIQAFSKDAAAKRYVKLAAKLGRLPLPEEFKDYDKLLDTFGSPERVQRLALRAVNKTAFEGSREQRREDILTYLAILPLEGVKAPAATALPASVRADVKTIWGSYAKAVTEGRQFLFSLGNQDAVKRACAASPVGKLLPEDLYVHRSAEDDLPALLRVLLFAARKIVGEVDCDIIKISTHGRSVSFLSYAEFDSDPHPVLQRSVRVYLPKASYGIRDYSTYANPPILHRKETFVAPSYPHYELFRTLTQEEEAAGLLSSPTIGTRESWNGLLAAEGYQIDGHRLVRRPNVGPMR